MNENKTTSESPKLRRFRGWTKPILLSIAVALGLIAMGAQSAFAQYHSSSRYGHWDNYQYGYRDYGYNSYWYNDPYHYYTSPRYDHYGPHSAPHWGTHYHWSHGYHWGPHWQHHNDSHGSGGHWGYRPWRRY